MHTGESTLAGPTCTHSPCQRGGPPSGAPRQPERLYQLGQHDACWISDPEGTCAQVSRGEGGVRFCLSDVTCDAPELANGNWLRQLLPDTTD